jgi:dolichyl-phosphate-mannose-protein mannosyltransferase
MGDVGRFEDAICTCYYLTLKYKVFNSFFKLQKNYLKHWLVRIVLLILLPCTIYMSSFYIHFWILNRSGPDDAQMSSLFQAGLEGNSFVDNPIGM